MMKKIFLISAFLSAACFGAPVRSMLAANETELGQQDTIVPVEYIESTGTQYIDTGLPAAPRLGIEIDAQLMLPVTGGGLLFGGQGAWNTRHCFHVDASGHGGYAIGGKRLALSNFFPDMRFYLTYDAAGHCTIEGIGTLSFDWNFGSPNPNYTLFAFNNNGAIIGGNWRVYSFRGWNKTSEVDLIPVRFFDGEKWVGAMYDLVSESLFLNAGSGEFLIGPDL